MYEIIRKAECQSTVANYLTSFISLINMESFLHFIFFLIPHAENSPVTTPYAATQHLSLPRTQYFSFLYRTWCIERFSVTSACSYPGRTPLEHPGQRASQPIFCKVAHFYFTHFYLVNFKMCFATNAA